MKNIKRLGIYHSKDADGYFSGAVLLKQFGNEILLMGWDYSDDLPNIEELFYYDEIIMIDITFPLEYLITLSKKTNLTVIDHHISFKNKTEKYLEETGLTELGFKFIYSSDYSACEIGSLYYLEHISPTLSLVGSYDTWRKHGTEEWEKEIFPFKFFVYGTINKPIDVPDIFFDKNYHPFKQIEQGNIIMEYEKKMDETKTATYAHEEIVYDGLRGLCMNTNLFSSETMISLYDSLKHDIMIGYCYTGKNWSVSLRSLAGGINVSEIAQKRGGGGHFHASGYEVDKFEDIFK